MKAIAHYYYGKAARLYPHKCLYLLRWKSDLKLRIVQHNIRTVASYYKQIHTRRLAELLGLDEAQAERNVAGRFPISDERAPNVVGRRLAATRAPAPDGVFCLRFWCPENLYGDARQRVFRFSDTRKNKKIHVLYRHVILNAHAV